MGDHSDKSETTGKSATDEKDVRLASFRKETAKEDMQEHHKQEHRSGMNAPADPNSLTADMNFPPGIKPEDAIDPGRATPGAPPVDNRSGEEKK